MQALSIASPRLRLIPCRQLFYVNESSPFRPDLQQVLDEVIAPALGKQDAVLSKHWAHVWWLPKESGPPGKLAGRLDDAIQFVGALPLEDWMDTDDLNVTT